MRIVIVGKADEILPGLKKLGYPKHFYDKWGNPTADPTIKKSAGDITAQYNRQNEMYRITIPNVQKNLLKNPVFSRAQYS